MISGKTNSDFSIRVFGIFNQSEFGQLVKREEQFKFIPNKDNSTKFTVPGVYIWGFKRNKNFIPYYVGKHNTSISGRICSHIKDILKPTSTYMRLAEDYMFGLNGITPYWMDPKFPLMTAVYRKRILPNWYDNDSTYFESKINYLNNREFMERMTGREIPESKEYPISLDPRIKDTLTTNISDFCVCFLPLNMNRLEPSQVNRTTAILESYVKFRLKGRTVGHSYSLKKLREHMASQRFTINLTEHSHIDIFKPDLTDTFPGY